MSFSKASGFLAPYDAWCVLLALRRFPYLDSVNPLRAGDVGCDLAKAVVHHYDDIGLMLARLAEIEAKRPVGGQT